MYGYLPKKCMYVVWKTNKELQKQNNTTPNYRNSLLNHWTLFWNMKLEGEQVWSRDIINFLKSKRLSKFLENGNARAGKLNKTIMMSVLSSQKTK